MLPVTFRDFLDALQAVEEFQEKKYWERYWYREMKYAFNKSKYKPKNYKGMKKKKPKKRLGVKGKLKPEMKYYDAVGTALPSYTSSTAAATLNMTNMTQNDLATGVTGNKALLKSASCFVRITCAATTTGSGAYRVSMVYGKTAASGLLNSTGEFTMFQDMEYTDENVMLYDEVQTIDATSNRTIVFRGNVKLNHLFNGPAGWDVYLIIKTSGTLLTAAPTAQYSTRVRYLDA